MSVCVHVYAHICIYADVYACAGVYACIRVFKCLHTCPYTCVYVYICANVCVHVCVCIFPYHSPSKIGHFQTLLKVLSPFFRTLIVLDE